MYWCRCFIIAATALALMASAADSCAMDLRPLPGETSEEHRSEAAEHHTVIGSDQSARRARRTILIPVGGGHVASAGTSVQVGSNTWPLSLVSRIGGTSLLSLHCSLLT